MGKYAKNTSTIVQPSDVMMFEMGIIVKDITLKISIQQITYLIMDFRREPIRCS